MKENSTEKRNSYKVFNNPVAQTIFIIFVFIAVCILVRFIFLGDFISISERFPSAGLVEPDHGV
jgi:hypothetical protein